MLLIDSQYYLWLACSQSVRTLDVIQLKLCNIYETAGHLAARLDFRRDLKDSRNAAMGKNYIKFM